MQKRDRQPEMPGSRRFPFREPAEGSRWVRYLKEIGTDPSKTPDQERADLIDGFAGVFLQETREAFLANGATDLDGALAPYIRAAVEYQVAIFALGLKELDQRPKPNPASFHRMTCPDPMEPEYGCGRNVAVAQMSGQAQIYSQAHGGTVYRLYRDEAERAKAERGPAPEDFFVVDPHEYMPRALTEPDPELTAMFEANAAAVAKAEAEAEAHETAPAIAWPEPFDIFGDARPAQLSSPPPGSLPDVLERWSRSEARRKGVSEAFAAAAALAVVAGSIGNGPTIQPRRKDTGWKVPSALWISLVDQPGSGKSPVIATALRPLNELDAERRSVAAAHAKLEQAARAADPKGRKGPPVAKPVPRSLVDNTTMEKLVSLLAENPRGLLQKPDELAALFGALGAYKKSGEGDRGQLLRLYDGGSITVDRQGRERRTRNMPCSASCPARSRTGSGR